MATAQATRVAEVTETASLSLVQNVLRVSLSEICWLRNLFPSDVFRDAAFGNTSVKFLNAKSTDGTVRNEEAASLVACLEAAMEALELKYLQSMVLAVYSADEVPSDRRLLESYVFDVSYPTVEQTAVVISANSSAFAVPVVKNSALVMLRQLMQACSSMPAVPEDRVLSLKLFYNASAPADYEPKHFSAANAADFNFFRTPPYRADLGSLGTRYHGMNMKAAFSDELSPADDESAAKAAAGDDGVSLESLLQRDTAAAAAVAGSSSSSSAAAASHLQPSAAASFGAGSAKQQKARAAAAAATGDARSSSSSSALQAASAGVDSERGASREPSLEELLPPGSTATPAAFALARAAVLRTGCTTMRAMQEALRAAAAGPAGGPPPPALLCTQQVMRDLFAALVRARVLTDQRNGRWALGPVAIAAAAEARAAAGTAASGGVAAAAASGGAASAGLAASLSSPAQAGSPLQEQAGSRPAPLQEQQKPLQRQPQPQQPAFSEAAVGAVAALLLAKATVLVLQPAALADGGNSGGISGTSGGYVSAASLARFLGKDDACAAGLLAALLRRGLLAPAATRGRGHAVLPATAASRTQLQAALALLRDRDPYCLRLEGVAYSGGAPGAAATAAAVSFRGDADSSQRQQQPSRAGGEGEKAAEADGGGDGTAEPAVSAVAPGASVGKKRKAADAGLPSSAVAAAHAASAFAAAGDDSSVAPAAAGSRSSHGPKRVAKGAAGAPSVKDAAEEPEAAGDGQQGEEGHDGSLDRSGAAAAAAAVAPAAKAAPPAAPRSALKRAASTPAPPLLAAGSSSNGSAGAGAGGGGSSAAKAPKVARFAVPEDEDGEDEVEEEEAEGVGAAAAAGAAARAKSCSVGQGPAVPSSKARRAIAAAPAGSGGSYCGAAHDAAAVPASKAVSRVGGVVAAVVPAPRTASSLLGGSTVGWRASATSVWATTA